MQNYILYSDVDQAIVDEMAGQAPGSEYRLRAIIAEIRNLQTKYNIESYRRKKSVSIKSDGTAYLLSSLITNDDVRSVESVMPTFDSALLTELVPVDNDEIVEYLKNNKFVNVYSVYYEDGKRYIKVLTADDNSDARDFDIYYNTTNLAIDSSGNFYSVPASGGNLYLLLPDKFMDLVSLGAQKRLFYKAIGESDQAQVALVRNRYESELSKLGLDSISKMITRNTRKFKLRSQL